MIKTRKLYFVLILLENKLKNIILGNQLNGNFFLLKECNYTGNAFLFISINYTINKYLSQCY